MSDKRTQIRVSKGDAAWLSTDGESLKIGSRQRALDLLLRALGRDEELRRTLYARAMFHKMPIGTAVATSEQNIRTEQMRDARLSANQDTDSAAHGLGRERDEPHPAWLRDLATALVEVYPHWKPDNADPITPAIRTVLDALRAAWTGGARFTFEEVIEGARQRAAANRANNPKLVNWISAEQWTERAGSPALKVHRREESGTTRTQDAATTRELVDRLREERTSEPERDPELEAWMADRKRKRGRVEEGGDA